ncbi:SDR family NAD(P)-dependent oxidoreductase [Oceanicoccus sp. KOV_DT_Chl]|uniref:SDR family NAD(P)-dependent oxidoreductase n=1 Tax=Oceanicoccus sp. KOV_DT_Chl TaxID=1904639 RepID=UPI000C79EBC3|nr:SDR family NAD(P)-dependent oxidoreductase [Oceanicoccus sp. KOV_DT_Chl]
MKLKDKIIVVTGGLGSLGRAVSKAAAQVDATVIAVDMVNGEPEAGVERSPALDLGDATATAAGLTAIAEKYGRIDALVNIAGGFRWETIADGSIETWDLLYQMNVRTAVNASRGALPYFPAGGGRIVNISAAGAVKADIGMGAYAASKSGVARFTEALAEELKSRDITVNALLPSVIDTQPNRNDMPDADFSTWVTPEALAAVILFLLSEQAAVITGALIPVTGRV